MLPFTQIKTKGGLAYGLEFGVNENLAGRPKQVGPKGFRKDVTGLGKRSAPGVEWECADIGVFAFGHGDGLTVPEIRDPSEILSDETWDKESGFKAGIIIGNSEVGMGSVSVEPFVFRKACTSDLIVAQEKSFRHAHIHLTGYEMTRRMAEAVSEGFRVSSVVLTTFLKARKEPIVDPLETIRIIAEERQLSQKFTDSVVSGYLAEPEPNRFGVINAFTRAAQGPPSR